MKAKVLFPCHPLKAKLPDPDYEGEAAAARDAGFECEFYDLEVLRDGNAGKALSACPEARHHRQRILHRGWMMTDELYAQLNTELVRKGYAPVVNPGQYAEAHYLPNAYPKLDGLTPKSAWIPGTDVDAAWRLYQQFKHEPAIVKDFVKSAKHRWNEACFIPADTGREAFNRILNAFLQARGKQFNKGIVFRRFHALVTLERDIRGQPVHEEYRMFFFGGALLAATPALRGNGPFDEIEKWTEVAQRFDTPFISMDVTRQEDGSWIIIEVGDGGVSGIPTSIDFGVFYRGLANRISD